MKYPQILFFRYDKYKDIDEYFIENKLKMNFTLNIINNKYELNKLYNTNYPILITFGDNETEYYKDYYSILPKSLTIKWIHYSKTLPLIDKFNYSLNYCFINNCIINKIKIRPIFSIFTTTYNSYDKILRAYNSLKKQTMIDWEWVILDDSPDDNYFIYLKENLLNDNKIRLYKRAENSGNIGNVKNEVVSLCRGKYVIEFDHDDELIFNLLEITTKYFDENDDVGFIYTDFINLYENGSNFKYNESKNFGKGYSSYYCQKYNNNWVNVYITPNINNITLSHLTCCPNHPRIWRRDILLKAGNYCEYLPICDDYEILLRTALITKMVKINILGYIQYMNNNNNNFSLIRNSEINRIGPFFISPIFYDKYKIDDFMLKHNAYDDIKYKSSNNYKEIWKRKDYTNCNYNITYTPYYNNQYCIIGLDYFNKNLNKIKELYNNKEDKNDFILIDNKNNNTNLWNVIDYNNLYNFKCKSFDENTTLDELINYFRLLYKSSNTKEFILY